jgi:hypothetical protein
LEEALVVGGDNERDEVVTALEIDEVDSRLDALGEVALVLVWGSKPRVV